MDVLPITSSVNWVVPEKDYDINTVLNLFEFCDDSPLEYQPSSPMSTPQLSPCSSDDGSATEFDCSIFDDPSVLPDIQRILAEDTITNPPLSLPSSWALQGVQVDQNLKKRPRDDVKDDVLIPRDQLLSMTSKEIEEYASKLKGQRILTIAEEKELKRQRRLIKNREYASQSRNRKKAFVDDLQKKFEGVQEENDALKNQVRALSEENQVLKRKIGAIADSIKKKTSSDYLKKFTTIGRPNPNKTISACLMVMLFMAFTFGVFWESPSPKFSGVFPNGKPIHLTTRVLFAMTEKNHLPIIPALDPNKIEAKLSQNTSQSTAKPSQTYYKDL